MTDNVKKELELHVRELQHSIDNIVPYADTTEDVVKMNFESIRLLVDYCEGLKNEKSNESSLCFRLSNFKGGMQVQKEKVLEALSNKECGYFYETNQKDFIQIPGAPIAYWISDNMKVVFLNSVSLEKIGKPEQGMATADNGRFVRCWYEVNNRKISIFESMQAKWYPYNNSGGFRKWYGFNIDVVNWENDGREIKAFPKAYVRNERDYFKSGITWNAITSSDVSVRFFEEGFIFSNAGMAIFTSEKYECYDNEGEEKC